MIQLTRSRYWFNVAFILLIICENFLLLYTYKHQFLGFGQTKNATALFACSLLIGILLLYKFYNKQTTVTTQKPPAILKICFLLLAGIIIAFLTWLLKSQFTSVPLDYRSSDIIPYTEVLADRFISGQYVYKPFTEFGYFFYVTYMPMQWAPYLISRALHFDPRWVTFCIWNIAALVLFVRSWNLADKKQSLLVFILLYGCYFYMLKSDAGIFTLTIETMVAGYYMLFIAGLNSRSGYIQGLFIAVCLLSRYSLLLWLPLWCFTLLASGERKKLWKACATIIIVVCVLYVIPFLSKDWHILYNGYASYDKAAHYEWIHLSDDGYPIHLYSGAGFAHLFYEKLTMPDVVDKINVLKKVHLAVCFFSLVVMGIWYMWVRRRVNTNIFLMGSFKIYFTVFLAFIYVPYVYLMILGNFVSIAIFAEQLRYRISRTCKNTKAA